MVGEPRQPGLLEFPGQSDREAGPERIALEPQARIQPQDRCAEIAVIRYSYCRVFKTVDFSKELDRQPNEYPNKYPMKLSQRMDYGMEYYPELRELASEKSKRSVNVL